MYNCLKCGENNKKHASFCSKCGLPLKLVTQSKSSVVKRLVYVVMLVAVIAAGLFGAYYYINHQHQQDLETIKTLVVSGEFEEAMEQAEASQHSNAVTSLVFDVESEALVEAIDEQRLCYLNKYPNYNSTKGIEDCVYWKRAEEMERQEVWVNEYKQQEDPAHCRLIQDEYRKECDRLRKENFSSAWRFCGFDPSRIEPKCDYDAFKREKRDENSGYLTSQEWDGFMEQCTLQRCPLPSELNF
jgi:hypothetical protein